jgi:hypothetical protein
MVEVVLGEDLMETGCAVQVKAVQVECLPHCNDGGTGQFVLEKINLVKDVLADIDVGHASKLIVLGGQEVGAVEDPVIVATTTVEAVLLPDELASILPAGSFLLGTGWGFLSPNLSFLAEAFDGGGGWEVAEPGLPFCAKASPLLLPPEGRCW